MSNLATIVNNILADSGIDDINVVVTTGSYSNPPWITALAWTKITGAPANIVTGTGLLNRVAKFNSNGSTVTYGLISDDGSSIETNAYTYITKTLIPRQATSYATNFKSLVNSTAGWIYLGDLIIPQQGYNACITMDAGLGFNAALSQIGYAKLHIRTSNATPSSGFYFVAFAEQFGYSNFIQEIRITENISTNTLGIYIYCLQFIGRGYYKVEGSGIEYTPVETATAPPATYYQVPLSFTVNSETTINNLLTANSNFYVAGNTELTGRLRIQGGSDEGTQLNLWANPSGNTFLAGYNFSINTGSNSSRTQKFFISNTGDATFSSTVRVNGGELTVYNGSSVLFTGVDTGNSYVYLGTNTSGYGLSLQASGERIRIFNNGNVVVSSSPVDAGYKLDVVGTGRFTSNLLAQKVQVGTAATINDATGVGNTLQFANYSAGVFVTGSADSYIYKTSSLFGGLSAQTLIFQTRSDVGGGGFAFVGGSTPSAVATISSTGAATFNGGNILVTNVATSGYAFTSVASSWGSVSQIYTAIKIGAAGDNLVGTGVDLRAYSQYGTNAGTEFRLFVNSTSNVLTEALRIDSSRAATFSSLAGTGTRIVVADANGTLSVGSALSGYISGSGTTNYLPKFTGTSTIGDSLVFDNGTSVGIGTASPGSNNILNLYPSNKMLIVGSAASTASTNSTRSVSLWSTNNFSPWSSWVGTNLYTNGTNFYKSSDEAGNNWGNIAGILFQGANTSGSIAMRFVADEPSGNGLEYNIGSSITSALDSRTRMVITNNGAIGIGTTSPLGNLDVSTSANTSINITAGSTGLSRLIFGTTSGNNRGFIDYDNTSSVRAMIFRTNESEAMRITSAQNVLINQTNDDGYKLQLNGVSRSKGEAILGDFSNLTDFGQTGMYATNSSFADGFGSLVLSSRSDASRPIIFTTSNGTSATERMRITGGGIVSIGASDGITTSTYAGKLAVYTAGGANLSIGGGSNTTNAVMSRFVTVNTNNANSGNEGSTNFYGITSIESALTTSNSNASGNSGGYIMFKTKGDAGALDERMRITSGGSVGIGTTSPSSLFSVQGNTDLGNSYSSTNSSTYTTRISGYAMRYDASNRYGNYGILILNADNGWTASARRFMITNGLNVNKFAIIRSVDATTDPSFGDGGAISSGTADFVIDSAGNVGIGTTSPTAKLQLEGNSILNGNVSINTTYNGFALNVSGVAYIIGGSAWVQNGYGYVNSGATSTGLYPMSDNTIQLRIANSTAVTVSSSSNLLVGTTTDSGFKLDVNGTLRSVGTIRSNQGYAYSNGIINITGGSSSWIFLGTISIAQGGNTAVITIEGGSGYNADENQNGSARIFIRTSNGSPNGSGWYYSATLSQTGYNAGVASSCIITQTNATTYNVYVNFGQYSGNTYYKVEGSEFTWTASNSNYGATAPTGGQTLTNVFKVISASTFASSVGISGNVDIGGYTHSEGRVRIQGGSDQGSQLNLWANSSGNTFLAGFNFAIHTGSNNSRTQKFFISNTGDATFSSSVTASSFFESSDSRIKILLEDDLDYLSIANVSAKYYEKNGKAELGYFAQDFESILPSAISKNEDGYLNLSYREVHTAKIAALEKEVKELKEKLKNK